MVDRSDRDILQNRHDRRATALASQGDSTREDCGPAGYQEEAWAAGCTLCRRSGSSRDGRGTAFIQACEHLGYTFSARNRSTGQLPGLAGVGFLQGSPCRPLLALLAWILEPPAAE